MSWNIELEPKKLYSQTPPTIVEITNIALVNPKDNTRHIVKLVVDGKSYVLCILQRDGVASKRMRIVLDADKEFTLYHEGTSKIHLLGRKPTFMCFAGSDSEVESVDLSDDVAGDQDLYAIAGSDDSEDSDLSESVNSDDINEIIKGEFKKRKLGEQKVKSEDPDVAEPPAKKMKVNDTKAVNSAPQTPAKKNNDQKAQGSNPTTPKTNEKNQKNNAPNKSNNNTPKSNEKNQNNKSNNNTPKTNEKKPQVHLQNKTPDQSPAAKINGDKKTPTKQVVTGSPKIIAKASEIIPELEKINRPVMAKKRRNSFLIDELKFGEGNTPKIGQTVKLDYVISMPNGEVVTGKQNEEVRLGFMNTFRALELGAEGMFDGGIRRIYVTKRDGEDIKEKCGNNVKVEETLNSLIDDQVAFVIDVKLRK